MEAQRMFDEDDDKEPFLLVLGVLAGVLAIVSWWFLDGRSDDGPVAAEPVVESPETTVEGEPTLTASDVTITLGADAITLDGVVPDAATSEAMEAKAVEVFGEGNVVNNLTIDDTTTTAGGTVTIVGTVGGESSRERVVDAFAPLATGAGYEVDDQIQVNEVVPSAVVMAIDGDTVTLTGAVPDEGTKGELNGLASTIFGAENVTDELTIDPNTTTEGGSVTIEGEIAGQGNADRIRNGVAAGLTGGSYAIDDQSTVGESTVTVELNDLFSLDPIEFDSNSAAIRPSEEDTLNRAAEILLANPDVSLEVQGHTDSTGPADGNLVLSQTRADSVRAYLVGQGVAEGQLTAVGYGESQLLIEPDDTPEAQQSNRRIVFIETN
ncbi:MAG: OmpA family protein [Acidimicrobiales bacterium]|nr:OmpA family protein [Acidimicrobiales bacterium]